MSVERQPYDPNILETLKSSLLVLEGVLQKKLEEEEARLLNLQSEMPELLKLSKIMEGMKD
jgi:hypothetical protein